MPNDGHEADAASLGERIPITPLVAFGYMVFVLIYFPCIATLAAIKAGVGQLEVGRVCGALYYCAGLADVISQFIR